MIDFILSSFKSVIFYQNSNNLKNFYILRQHFGVNVSSVKSVRFTILDERIRLFHYLVLLDRLLLLLLDLLYLGVQPGPPPQEQEDCGNHQEGGEASGQEEQKEEQTGWSAVDTHNRVL